MGVRSAYWAKYRQERLEEMNSSWYRNLRKYIFARDKYTCALTGKTNCKLNMHHIKRYCDNPSLRYDARNLITLSEEAHESIKNKEYLFEEKLWELARAREARWRSENGTTNSEVPKQRRRSPKAGGKGTKDRKQRRTKPK